MFDLVVRGGTVATETGTECADVGISGGAINSTLIVTQVQSGLSSSGQPVPPKIPMTLKFCFSSLAL